MGLPFTTGKLAPSTWVMKKPWGRRVMTATWTPGLPSVVSGLVRSSSLPALAPERSCSAAFFCGAAAGLGGATGGVVALWPATVSLRFFATAAAATGAATAGPAGPGRQVLRQ